MKPNAYRGNEASETTDGSLENNQSSEATSEGNSEITTDGGFNTTVVEAICEFIREDLDRGEWNIYYAKRIAKHTAYSAARVGWYLGNICGVQSAGQEIDIADFAPETEIEQWIPASSVCRWRIERHDPTDTPTDEKQRLVTDGGFSESFDEFVDPRTDEDRTCERCGDAVPRRFLKDGVCIGCRVHQAAAEGQR